MCVGVFRVLRGVVGGRGRKTEGVSVIKDKRGKSKGVGNLSLTRWISEGRVQGREDDKV